MIEINEQFDVSSPPRTVWDLLSDPEAVVTCVPGATLGEKHEDGSFDGGVTVKFGPARVTFRARVELELDPAEMTGRVNSRGKDSQGGTRFNATMS
ncbi:MAG: SRPBCC domain-containing protein, partial [Burkholderiales bacterium]